MDFDVLGNLLNSASVSDTRLSFPPLVELFSFSDPSVLILASGYYSLLVFVQFCSLPDGLAAL